MYNAEVVFDVNNNGYQGMATFVIPTVLITVLVVQLIIFKKRKSDSTFTFLMSKVSFGGIIFGCFWLAFTFFFSFSNYIELKENLQSKKYNTVQGMIDNYKSFGENGREESFSVSDIVFRYNPYMSTHAFNNAHKDSNIIANGMHVKIFYMRKDGVNNILRIEKYKYP